MKVIARLAVKLALWALKHPELVTELVDAIHAAKQKPATSADLQPGIR